MSEPERIEDPADRDMLPDIPDDPPTDYFELAKLAVRKQAASIHAARPGPQPGAVDVEA